MWKGSDANTVIKDPAALHKLCTLKCKKANGKVTILTSGQSGGFALAGMGLGTIFIKPLQGGKQEPIEN